MRRFALRRGSWDTRAGRPRRSAAAGSPTGGTPRSGPAVARGRSPAARQLRSAPPSGACHADGWHSLLAKRNAAACFFEAVTGLAERDFRPRRIGKQPYDERGIAVRHARDHERMPAEGQWRPGGTAATGKRPQRCTGRHAAHHSRETMSEFARQSIPWHTTSSVLLWPRSRPVCSRRRRWPRSRVHAHRALLRRAWRRMPRRTGKAG